MEESQFPELQMHRNQKYISCSEAENQLKAEGKIVEEETIRHRYTLVF